MNIQASEQAILERANSRGACPRRRAAEYKLTLKSLTDDQLFEAWSREYDAKHPEHVKLIIAEMDVRNAIGVIQL
jgi:hypothetical protein